jgi:FKBP-type peptidyl-prolyl cis-trans isomerase SlyD
MEIVKDAVVEFDFNLTDKDGKVLDTSDGAEPLLYIHGYEQMLPKLEAELEGKKKGDKFKLVVAAEDGYGVRDEELLMEVPITEFGDESDHIVAGAQFWAHSGEEERLATVVSREGDDVVVDLNHPLADVELHFDVEIISARVATEEELTHGHVHSHGESCSH